MNNIIEEIYRLANGNQLWIAFSGGVDSHVLLHLLATANQGRPPKAIHIDHGLQTDSEQWTKHCETVARELSVSFTSIKVKVVDTDDKGIEAAARTARYTAIQDAIENGDLVLTAQHQEDQAETLLLQLFRGAGPKGLSAMAEVSTFGGGKLVRPLLHTTKTDILAYAKQHDLKWIEDPSNTDVRWDRNFLRHQVWPKLTQRWPAAAKTLSRSAEHCADASDLLEVLAEQDLKKLDRDKQSLNLPVSSLLALPKNRCRNLLRHWCEWQGLPFPSTAQLQHIIDDICLASEDATPLVQWQGVEVRRYQELLYFMGTLTEWDSHLQVELLDDKPISFGENEQISWRQELGKGLSVVQFNGDWNLRFRRGGEKIQLMGRSHHSQLKHLMQDWQVPPWLRDRVPLIFDGDQLIAVAGYGVAEGYAASADELGMTPYITTAM